MRHAQEGKRSAERLAERDAQQLLDAGAETLGGPDVTTHVVLSASTPNGLRDLALELDAGTIVFGSEYRTARGHVDPQASARRLLDGGPIAVALAPAGFHALADYAVGTVGSGRRGRRPLRARDGRDDRRPSSAARSRRARPATPT